MKISLVVLVSALLVLPGSGAVVWSPRIADVQIKLFCHETGDFTEDILSLPDVMLWNTVIGEGSAPCAATSTLVVYVVEGPPSSSLGDYTLSLVAAKRSADSVVPEQELSRVEMRLGVTNAEGRVYVPLLLNGTGCDEIRIGAMIRGAPPAIQTVIPFRCGE